MESPNAHGNPYPAPANKLPSHRLTDPNTGVSDTTAAQACSLRQSAHDLRNSLNVIRNAAYLLRRKLVAGGGENVDLVDMIEDSVKSAEAIAADLTTRAVLSEEQSGHAGQSDGRTGQPGGK